MGKIYIIDDNSKNQRELYGASFVDSEEFADVLCHVERLNAQSDLSFLDDAICVMIHDSLEDYINGSFISSSHKAKERIEDYIQEKSIPYVLFSDGHAMTADWRENTPNIVYSIKKSEFYKNLIIFLEEYLLSHQIDLRVLAFGKNYIKQLMWNWCRTLISNCWIAKDDDILTISMIDYKALHKIINNTQPKIDISFSELMEKIDDGDMSVGAFRTNINSIINSIEKYGTNIYSWK